MFDLEGERGIVVRGYGTAAVINKIKLVVNNKNLASPPLNVENKDIATLRTTKSPSNNISINNNPTMQLQNITNANIVGLHDIQSKF